MQVKISQAITMLTQMIKARLVPMLVGSPAVGKSSIAHQIAAQYNLKVIDLRLSQCDPTDLMGFPTIKGDKASYVPMDTFPVEGDPIPAGYSGWMLFLDELNGAPLAVQKAAYKLILDRMVGSHHLHKNVAIIAAGNLETDGAAVETMSTALQSRLIHLELVADPHEWVEWASANNVDHRITSFIGFKPSNLYTFSPDHTDKTYASPRTWHFASQILAITPDGSKDLLPILAGTISEGVAREFISFCKIHESLPKIHEIAASPKTTNVPSEPSILYALTGSIGAHADEGTIAPLLEYVSRMPAEFQVVTLREVIRRNRKLMAAPAVQSWISKSATNLF